MGCAGWLGLVFLALTPLWGSLLPGRFVQIISDPGFTDFAMLEPILPLFRLDQCGASYSEDSGRA